MGAIVVAAAVRKEREVVEQFLFAGATSPATAKYLNQVGIDPTSALERLRQRAVLRETADGAYYIDQLSWQAMNSTRRTRVAMMLIIAALMLIGGLFVSRIAPGREEPFSHQQQQ